MKKIDKKTASLFIILLCFIIGGSLSFESLARFTKKFEIVNKKVSVATFEVSADSEFVSEAEIKPGDVLSADTIKLKNDNDYPVEFTISLSEKSENNNKDKSTSEGAKDLIKYLTLTIEGVNQTESKNHYTTIVNPNNEKVVSAKIEWITDDDIEIYENDILDNIARYTYDIKAKQVLVDDTIPPSTSDENKEIVFYKSDFGNTSYIHDWKIYDQSIENIKKVYIKDSSLIVGTRAWVALGNENLDLKSQKLYFDAEIEILDELNNSKGNGFNLTVGIRDTLNEDNSNNFTYQFYKVKEDDKSNIFTRLTNNNGSNLQNVMYLKDDNDIVIDSEKLILIGEIELNGDETIVCNLIIKDYNSKTILYEKRLEGRKYSKNNKIFINISGFCGGEGVKINSMEVKAKEI